MRIGWKVAGGLLLMAGAVLGTILASALGSTSSGSGAAQYEVTVHFNTTVTQADIDEAGALLRTFDDDLDFVIMESFPPIGRAVVAADAPDFCRTVQAQLEAKGYVRGVSCQPWSENDGADPDAPVSSDNEADS